MSELPIKLELKSFNMRIFVAHFIH